MKALIFSLVTLLSFSALAQDDLTLMNQKADELDLAQEVEDLEQYGESAGHEEAKRESQRLARETRQLESDLQKYKSQEARAKKKTVVLSQEYKQKSTLAAKAQSRAVVAERNKARAENEVAKLKTKVENKEQQVIAAVEKRKAAEVRARELQREKSSLQARLKKAERQITINKMRQKKQQQRIRTLTQKNRELGKKVARAERQAGRVILAQ